jgi:hypothetical protein
MEVATAQVMGNDRFMNILMLQQIGSPNGMIA